MTALAPPQAHSIDEVKQAITAMRTSGAEPAPVIVFTNGVFDLPHPGHLRSLRAAKALGDILIVAINSDESVARLKGPTRPIIPANERSKILAAMDMVDYVVIFSEDTPLKTVEALQPDVIAKGAEYRGREVVGADVVIARGGKVEFLPMENGISSTEIIDRIRRAHSQ